jgi:ABC-type transport system involved in cytochrome c biogenesis permease component
MSLSVLGAELRHTWRLARSYWLQYVSDFVLYSSGFLVFVVVLRAATDTYGPQGYLSTLIGYTIWIICATVTSAIARAVVQEAHTGTLEQLFLTGRRPGLVLLGRSVGLFFDYGARGLMMLPTGAFVGLEKLGGFFTATKLLFPLTWGISLLRALLSGDATLLSLWQSRALIGLGLHAVLYLALGLTIFGWGYRTARRQGTLAHY